MLHSKSGGQWVLFRLAPFTSGVPQGSILGSMLFSIFMKDLSDGIESTLTEVAEGTKLGDEVNMSEGRSIRRVG